jgi:hypothetical protein
LTLKKSKEREINIKILYNLLYGLLIVIGAIGFYQNGKNYKSEISLGVLNLYVFEDPELPPEH